TARQRAFVHPRPPLTRPFRYWRLIRCRGGSLDLDRRARGRTRAPGDTGWRPERLLRLPAKDEHEGGTRVQERSAPSEGAPAEPVLLCASPIGRGRTRVPT